MLDTEYPFSKENKTMLQDKILGYISSKSEVTLFEIAKSNNTTLGIAMYFLDKLIKENKVEKTPRKNGKYPIRSKYRIVINHR